MGFRLLPLFVTLLSPAALGSAVEGVTPATPHRGDRIFEADLEGENALRGWESVGDSKGSTGLGAGEKGSSCVEVERPVTAGAGSTMLRRAIPVEALRGARIYCEARVRAEAVARPPQPYNGVKLMLQVAGPAGPRWFHRNNLHGSFDWQTVRFAAPVPRNVKEAWLVLGLEATTGKAWFDDIRVTVGTPPRRTPDKRPGPETLVFKGHDLPRLRGVMISNDPKETDLRDLGLDWKANVIRWQLHRPEVNYGNVDGRDMKAFDSWLAGKLDRLDELLPVCREAGLLVVVDLHTPPGGHDDAHVHRIFQEKVYQDRFLSVWKEIAGRYASEKSVWGYDILNEPVQGAVPPELMDWQELATETARLIRSLDSKHAIIVEPEPWGGADGFDFLEPLSVSGVVYSPHMYQPHPFTHQGVFGQPTGVRYPGRVGEKDWDRDALRAALEPAIRFQRDYGAHIFVGEFSAIRWAPDGSACRYLRDVIGIFEECGWDWTYHAFREWSGWSVEHGEDPKDTSPSKSPTEREKLLRSWFEKNERPSF